MQFDLHLSMEVGTSECAVEWHWRLLFLMRSRRYFTLERFGFALQVGHIVVN